MIPINTILLKLKRCFFETYFFPTSNTVEGKPFWLGKSGKCCVPRHKLCYAHLSTKSWDHFKKKYKD